LILRHPLINSQRSSTKPCTFAIGFIFFGSSTHAELLTQQDQKSPYPIFSAHKHSDFETYCQDVDKEALPNSVLLLLVFVVEAVLIATFSLSQIKGPHI
jgi:hypothetical protein